MLVNLADSSSLNHFSAYYVSHLKDHTGLLQPGSYFVF